MNKNIAAFNEFVIRTAEEILETEGKPIALIDLANRVQNIGIHGGFSPCNYDDVVKILKQGMTTSNKLSIIRAKSGGFYKDTPAPVSEKVCNCGKKNDITSKKCWWCERNI